jgi:hypothetical protein
VWEIHILPQTETRRKEFDNSALNLESVDLSASMVVAYE